MLQYLSYLKKGRIFKMPTVTLVLLIIAIVLIVAVIVLYFLGKKAEKKKAEQDEQIAAAAQSVTMLIIDKKKLRLKDAGLPAAVVEQTPKLMRHTKMPIVKAKVGPKVMTFISDASIYERIPVKKEVKATVSGLYITGVRGVHGSIEPAAPKKKGIWARAKAAAEEKVNKKSK